MIDPWVRHGESYASLADDDEVLRVGVEQAAALIADSGARNDEVGARQTCISVLHKYTFLKRRP